MPTSYEELLQCYDDAGQPTEGVPRSVAKANPERYWIGVSNVWIVNSKGQVLCSKRSETVAGNPGKWQTYFGGHVPAGLSFEENAAKELQEETGLSFTVSDLKLVTEGRDDIHRKFFKSFAVRFEGTAEELVFADQETSEAKWMDTEVYWKEKEEHPDAWCNSLKPEHAEKIKHLL